MAGNTATGADIHHDAPLSNLAIRAFQGTEDFVGPKLFPVVPVQYQSNRYYVIDSDSWLRIPVTLRAPMTAPRAIEWRVSSDGYAVKNYASRGVLAFEDLANQDQAIMLEENTVRLVTEALVRALEDRLAGLVTSITNIGSGVVLSGGDLWSDYVNSDPISPVNTGHAFIENLTGLHANTIVLDKDTYRVVRRHPVILDMFKYTSGGVATDDQLKEVFEVQNLWIARGIKNNAVEGQAASITNIWGNNALLAYVNPAAVGLQTATFGLAMRWRPEGFADMQVERYDDPDPGKKARHYSVGYFQDEKIVARNLSYLINTTL